MNIYFARHGQTDWNTLGRVQGTTDIPLNEAGIQQADHLCDYFENENISLEKAYTSYQVRAVQTAQIVSDRFQIEYETVPGLEEVNMGVFEGHTWDEIETLYPAELTKWNSNKRYIRTPGGESYQMVLERLFRALDSIIDQYDKSSDKNLLIISHGGVIMTLIALHEDIRFEESHLKIKIPNALPIMFGIEELAEIRKKAMISIYGLSITQSDRDER